MSLLDEVKAVQRTHPGWSFQAAWDHVMALRPELAASTAESNRVAAKLVHGKEQEDREEFARVEGIARRLMDRNRKLTFGAALGIVRLCSPKPVEVKAAEQKPKPRTLLIRGSEGTYVD
jgi:hypothetical protein